MLCPSRHTRRVSARLFMGAAMVLASLVAASDACAQDVTEPALKAAFIYNFARFTTWPADAAPTDSFVICVLGDIAVSDALEHAVVGKKLFDRPITVSRVAPTSR